MESMFAMPPGSLTTLLGPRRPRGRRVPGADDYPRFTSLPRGDAVAEIVGEICPSVPSDVTGLYFEDQVTLSAGRTLSEITTRYVAKACTDGVSRCFAVSFADPGHDIDSIHIDPIRSCRVGRVRRGRDHSLVATELLLDRTYQTGEVFMIEYRSVVRQPLFDDECFRAFGAPNGLYTVQIRFDESELPVRCYRFDAPGPTSPRNEKEIFLTDRRTALMAIPDAGAGVLGIRWEWD
jgi:hypothetical protein